MLKFIAPFVMLLAVLGTVVWLDAPRPRADVVFAIEGEVFTLDPQRMSYVQDFRLAYALYEGLVRWDNHDFSIQPAVAESWEHTSDGLTWTFYLRPDAHWSDGASVTAHDFVYAWKRAILPETVADYSNMFFVIEGAEAFFEHRRRQHRLMSADPWKNGQANPETVLAMVERLQTLLNSEYLEEEVSPALAHDRAPLSRELDDLSAAVKRKESLNEALDRAATVRRIFTALDTIPIREAEALWWWQESEAFFKANVGVKALDRHKLQVKLVRPIAYFEDLLAFGVFYPVYRPAVEGWIVNSDRKSKLLSIGWAEMQPQDLEKCLWISLDPTTGKFEQKHGWTKPGFIKGNGPYQLVDWRYKRGLRIERNNFYHTQGMIRSDSIECISIPDVNTRVLAFESGEIDWLGDVNADYQVDMLAQRDSYVSRYRTQSDGSNTPDDLSDAELAGYPTPQKGERRDIHAFPTFGTDFFSFNCRKKLSNGRSNPFHHAGVRRAFVLSVNRHDIVEKVTRLNEPVVTTFIPPDSIPGYHNPEGLGFDPNRARKELADAGWIDRNGDGWVENKDGNEFPIVEILWTTNTPRYKGMSIVLREMWQRELGVRCSTVGKETKFYREDLKKGNFMIARGRWYGDYGDPTTFLDLCKTGDGNNDRGYSSSYVDDLLKQAADEQDSQERMKILEECERFLFAEEVPMLVICQLMQVYMYQPGQLTGLSHHPRLTQYLWQLEVHDENASVDP